MAVTFTGYKPSGSGEDARDVATIQATCIICGGQVEVGWEPGRIVFVLHTFEDRDILPGCAEFIDE